MVQLPQMPPRIARLPRDSRGFPVPWFVQWFENGDPAWPGAGAPDFRVADARKFHFAIQHQRCWVCGESLGRHKIFVIGPMCVVNRVTSEPPNHRDCAEFAAKACPFLTQPRMRRNVKNLPDEGVDPAGFHIDRNPGATCLYETNSYKPFQPHRGGAGILFRLGDPVRIDWYANGQVATREQVLQSIESGFPILEKIAQLDGAQAVAELSAQRDKAMKLLPA
jgi:ferredoxin